MTLGQPPILVLDGEQRAALAVTRSLVRAGYPVLVHAASRWAPAAMSRGARFVPRTQSALESPAAYVAEVARLARELGAAVVLPCTDASVQAVLEHRGRFADGAVLPLPSLETFGLGSDKIRVHELAIAVGLGIDDSVVVSDPATAAPTDPRLYPGVVKPHRSVVGTERRLRLGVRTVRDAEECSRVLAELPADAFPVLVQRRVRGDGVGYFAARWRGETLARFAHRRVREKPPGGGVSVLSESIAIAPQVQAACDTLLDRLGWDGVAMVECKEEAETGRWRVIEVNGRFWGSLQLAIDAGVDFPRILVDAALGGPSGPTPSWRAGVRLRWELGDLDHLLLRLRYSRERLGLADSAPGRLGALLAFLTHRPGQRGELLRWRDPLPFVGELAGRLLPGA